MLHDVNVANKCLLLSHINKLEIYMPGNYLKNISKIFKLQYSIFFFKCMFDEVKIGIK